MGKGQYVVYERASRGEERFFLDVAKEVIDQVGEPKSWKRYDPKNPPGGRPLTYSFRQMILILMLMVHHRKEYREMEAHLNNNPHLLQELGLERSPGKSTMQRACARIGLDTLADINDAIIDRFKKILEELERDM